MPDRRHGQDTRGLGDVPRVPSYEGRFGRMFQQLPSFEPDDAVLTALAQAMRDEAGASGGNPAIPSGYTYLGQFIDHDLTFDAASAQQRILDPSGRLNFRSPRFDLDSVYGSGPVDEPFQYDRNSPGGIKLLIGSNGSNPDLPRNSQGRALIGDPRNDENFIVAQLHLAFLHLHNRLVDQLANSVPEPELFESAQREARWHYQWVVVHDYLRRTVGAELHDRLLTTMEDDEGNLREVIRLRFYRHKVNPYMPVEFSVAAYRFGHTQVRDRYGVNNTFDNEPLFSPGGEEDLRGFRPLLPNWHVSWPRFFAFPNDPGPQLSRLIDTALAVSLFALPGGQAEAASLALRNLRAGVRLALPPGQAVAERMKVPVLTDAQLAPCPPGGAPIWYYVLREASVLGDGGQRLGPVGGRIVAETLLGLLRSDPASYYSSRPTWTPTLPSRSGNQRDFDMVDLLSFAAPDQARRF